MHGNGVLGRRMKKEAKKIEKGNVRDRIANLENQRKAAEEREKERKDILLHNKKGNSDKIRKAAAIQEGWKELMEKVSKLEEFDEIMLEGRKEAVNNCSYKDWTTEGVTEAGSLLEELLEEIIA